MKKYFQKGASLYFTVFILTIMMAIVLGLSSILIGQTRMLKGMGDSVIAFFAADSGIERILYLDNICRQLDCELYPDGGICHVEAGECKGLPDGYSFSEELNSEIKFEATVNDIGGTIHYKSLGTFIPTATKRAVEVQR